ncbi:MAG: hypothetical protein GY842_03185 [bacterium]|nr:hypothetical protein [bacterium]
MLGQAALLCVLALHVSADDWPAESFSSAENITVSGMESDLSGAHWSPPDASLWVVRQNRQVWKLQESGGVFSVVNHWTNLPTDGDLEAITQTDPAESDMFCVLHEDDGTVYRIDVSGGSPSLVRSWQLTLNGDMPYESGGQGPEGMAFVPDEWLGGFVDGAGQPYTSVKGMGGLLFVGHQTDGHVYVFDLDPDSDDGFDFVGEYATSRDEVAALEFDRANGLLYMFHNSGGTTWNETEVTDLTSSIDGSDRKFTTIRSYSAPPDAGGNTNMEGIALSHSDECDVSHNRYFFITLDGGGSESLKWFEEFPCDCNANGVDDADDIAAGTSEDCNANGLLDACDSIDGGDFDADSDVDLDDCASFTVCLAGPESLPDPADAACVDACLSAFDSDSDNDVDLLDFAEFLGAFTG